MLKKKYDGLTCTVSFTVPARQANGASSAFLVGDFSNWDHSALPMKPTKDGGFQLSLRLDAGREYLFRYLFDGSRWDNDWHADKYLASPYHDSENSVVIV